MVARAGIVTTALVLSTLAVANAQTTTASVLQEESQSNSVAPVPLIHLDVSDIDYPVDSIIQSEEGSSTLNLIVDSEGRVSFVQLLVSSGSRRLDQVALETAGTRWRFQPARKDGQVTVGSLKVQVNWKLPTRPAEELVHEMTGMSIAGRNVVPPSMVREAYRMTSADYPPASARAGEVGEPAVKVLVLEDGSVGDVQLFDATGYSRLDERAMFLARERFKYRPGTVDGTPTRMWLDVLVGFVGALPGGRSIPQNALVRFCHSRPIIGPLFAVSRDDASRESGEGPTLVRQWIHLKPDGGVDDVLMATSSGWVHLSETLVADYSRAARLRPAVANRPPSCWYNGITVVNVPRPEATSTAELIRRGTAYLRQGQLTLALNDYEEGLKTAPNNPVLLNNRCYTLALAGRAQEALADCDKALQLRPHAPNALDSRGFVYLLLSNYQAAIADFDAALRAGQVTANSLYGRGVAKVRLGNEVAGRADIDEAMKLDQNITARMTMFGLGP